jgi:hypothetical protein
MRAARDRFKRKLTAARQKSWDLFVQRDLTDNSWGVTYRLAAEKFHKARVLSCFSREDNSATLTPQDTLEYLLHKLLPDDDPSTNTHLQQNAQRDFTALEPLPHEAASFTEDDLNRLIQEIKPNKAPGTDRLPGRLIKLLHPWTGRSLLRIYNACWSRGYFPQAWKRGNLVVLLKDPSGDVGSAKNYRPITLLPNHAATLPVPIWVFTRPLHYRRSALISNGGLQFTSEIRDNYLRRHPRCVRQRLVAWPTQHPKGQTSAA